MGVWGQVEGRGAEGPDAARGWQEGAASALLGSSRSYFYGRGPGPRLGEESQEP